MYTTFDLLPLIHFMYACIKCITVRGIKIFIVVYIYILFLLPNAIIMDTPCTHTMLHTNTF